MATITEQIAARRLALMPQAPDSERPAEPDIQAIIDARRAELEDTSEEPQVTTMVPRAYDPAEDVATPETDLEFGALTSKMSANARSAFMDYATGIFDPQSSPSYSAMPDDWSPALKRMYAPLADIGMAALSGVDVLQKGASGIAGDVANLAGAGRGDALARDLAGMPDAFIGSPGTLQSPRTFSPGQPMSRSMKPAAQDITEAGRRGIRTLTSDVVKPESFSAKAVQFLGEKIPIAGTGGIRAKQQGERVDAIADLARSYGVSNIDDIPADLLATIKKKRGDAISRYTANKREVINRVPGMVPVPKATQVIDAEIARLTALNTKEVAPIIARLDDWKVALSNQGLTEVEDLRKIIGEAYKSPDLGAVQNAAQKSFNKIYRPLNEDMGAFIKANGNGGDFNKWKVANTELSKLASELDNATLKSVLRKGDATPEDVGRLLFSRKKSDVEALYRSLTPEGRARAQSAVLARAFRDMKAITDGNLDVDAISPAKFMSWMNKAGPQIAVMFKGRDRDAINGLMRALRATKRADQAGVVTPTGVQAVQGIGAMALGQLFGSVGGGLAAGGGLGLLTRAYESAPTRNILVKLSRAPKGSKAEARLLDDLGKALGNLGAAMPAASVAGQNGR